MERRFLEDAHQLVVCVWRLTVASFKKKKSNVLCQLKLFSVIKKFPNFLCETEVHSDDAKPPTMTIIIAETPQNEEEVQ